ncbi:MAG TPA: rhodanese-like domain-containing protein [Usitatibacter sp.]|nr:rhodanese-like domain-containing protein [Usitatibacter sp.]
MQNAFTRWLFASLAACLVAAQPALAAPGSPLVTPAWLKDELAKGDVLLIDTSPAKQHAAGHIPGAVHVDLYASGVHVLPPPALETRFQSWGLTPSRKVVVYDPGASMMATWMFYELYHYGFPPEKLFLLDGGLETWKASGGAVTQHKTPAPAKGDFRITQTREDVRVRLPEFLVASGDPARHALVEALEPNYHFGESKFFDRAGHVPNAVMMPTADFFNADKTFKSPEEIRRMATYFGIKPEQQVSSYCGGGVAATVPFFALKFVADYPHVKVYKESQMEWLRDDRNLPMWSYSAPYLKREVSWLNGWGSPMMRMFNVANVSVVDVRPAEQFGLGHVPYALSIPDDVFRKHLREPAELAQVLGPAGVDAAHEAVIMSSGGVNAASALAFVMLEKLGQKKVSIVMDSVDEWGLQGLPLTKEPTLVGPPKAPPAMTVLPTTYPKAARAGVLVRDARATAGAYPKVFLAAGVKPPATAPDGKVVHVPYTDLLDAKGAPKPAAEVWKILVKAGVPRYAEIICIADDPGEAAIGYYVLRLMGYPDVKVLV